MDLAFEIWRAVFDFAGMATCEISEFIICMNLTKSRYFGRTFLLHFSLYFFRCYEYIYIFLLLPICSFFYFWLKWSIHTNMLYTMCIIFCLFLFLSDVIDRLCSRSHTMWSMTSDDNKKTASLSDESVY